MSTTVATTTPPAATTNPRAQAYKSTPKTTIAIPANAFYVPTSYEYAMNQGYWNGWLASASFQVDGVILLPAPKGTGDYAGYSALFAPYYLPDNVYGWVNNEAVGWNNSINQGKNYVWQNDPESPHKVPS